MAAEVAGDAGITGHTIAEAAFDAKLSSYFRWIGIGLMCITVVGIPLIPIVWGFSFWYGPEYLRRVSARLTAQALEVKVGVFFRKEATIPLNRITDVRLHDGPLMRHYQLRGLKVETAGSAGQNAGSEGNLLGVIDAAAFRDAILSQRQQVLEAAEGRPAPVAAAPVAAASADAATLTEIRDILARIEQHLAGRNGA